ncbi:hypothetical protein POM88_031672 [Heracleum sosnowskyi]|uniref:PGG domain-containing protein n=1 Tax=Heracleum sosnowskyi TaxID=360622 RepID=A0AAD8HZ34_9APIA|nr:hypothetical protein POM88_031672 [Heracleum sosnowskyi]
MAYQAAISPPAGITGIDAKESTGHIIIKPGTSILAHSYPDENILFWRFNTVTFIASLSIVFFFVSGVSVKRKFFVWLLRATMWITIVSMTQAFLLAVSTFIPGTNEYYGTVVAILIAAVTWGRMILVSYFLITYRSIVAALWKAESRKNYSKYPSKIPPRLIVNLELKKMTILQLGFIELN